MKSIKRGRGPSMMDGFMCLAVGAFGVIWTFGAVAIGAGPVFALFGVVFVCVSIGQAVYSFGNATRKNRFSEYDVVTGEEETDPLNERFAGETRLKYPQDDQDGDPVQNAFCPYCGVKLEREFEYCNRCGRKLP